MTRDDHLRAFTTFAASLIDALGRYLDDPAADPAAIGYRQVALWLDAEERTVLIGELAGVLARYRRQEPSAGRTRLHLSTILIPDLTPTGTADGTDPSGKPDPRRKQRTIGLTDHHRPGGSGDR